MIPINRGLEHISGGQFSVRLQSVDTLYVNEGDLDPASVGGDPLIGRVYVHTIPPLYKLAGKAFVILIDYRERALDESAYMGDGIIHISATKFARSLTVMHEILHGLGATHQEWIDLEAKGYRFDSEDRGLMTFVRGDIIYLGLEEKNRALLGWPETSIVKFNERKPSDINVARLDEQSLEY